MIPRIKRIFDSLTRFSPEFLLLLVLVLAVGTNLALRANSKDASRSNKSLFFSYLKTHPGLNENLVEFYESVNLTLAFESPRRILAASTIEKKESQKKSPAAPLPTLSGQALLRPNPASTSGLAAKRDIEVYKVRGGDTVARIAGAYGVSINTILTENNLTTAAFIKPDQELRILPVTGVRHVIKEGETLTSIAKKYGLPGDDDDIEAILDENEIEIEDYLQPGDEIIIPNGEKKVAPTPQRAQYLANLRRDDYRKVEVPANYQGGVQFLWPLPQARRLSQRFWSRHPGIDVPCRDCAVVAAADGIVELAGWQRGYGYTIILNHGGGMRTRYGHAKELLVSAGAQVGAGQTIMISGSTGRSTGPHLHFEISKNSVRLNPLAIVGR